MPTATCGLTWMFDCTLRFPISPPATISTALSLSSTKSDIIRHSRGRIVPKVGHRFPASTGMDSRGGWRSPRRNGRCEVLHPGCVLDRMSRIREYHIREWTVGFLLPIEDSYRPH